MDNNNGAGDGAGGAGAGGDAGAGGSSLAWNVWLNIFNLCYQSRPVTDLIEMVIS